MTTNKESWESDMRASLDGDVPNSKIDEVVIIARQAIAENQERLLNQPANEHDQEVIREERRRVGEILEQKLLIKCECEDGDCLNCGRLLEVLGIINHK